jgi:iron complex outermembrane recepter protein
MTTHACCPATSRGNRNRLHLLFALLPLVALLASRLPAAESGATGSLSGTVSNAATAANLQGAQVVIQPGNISVLTSRDGRFLIQNLQPGDYTVTATYSGLDAKTLTARVEPGRIVHHDIGLTSEIYQLSQFVVEGEREGNALAITQQRNAANVKNVISADAFGNIADLNLGNFLLRMPGVSKEESEGEIIRVQIRGVDSNLSAVSVDGTRASNGSTRSFDRGFEIDKVPTDFIETIEITKAPTPDIDADSIGGAVNLRTKSALDRKGRRTTYQIGNSYNVRKETFRPLGSVSFSDILLDQKLGVLATASYNEAHKPRDSSNVDWERTADTTRPAAFTASSWGEDQLKHKRAGFGLRFDYRLTPTTKVYVNGMYSLYEDQLNRRRGSLSTPPSASNVVPGSVTDRVTETRNQMFSFTQNFRDRDVKTWNYQVGGDSTIWGGTLDFSANYSPSRGAEQRFVPTRRVANTGWRQEFTESRNWLVLRQTSGPDIYDWRNSTTVLETRDNTSRDLITGGQVNFRRTLGTEIPLSIKTGGRYRWQKREQDQNRRNYTYVGPDGVAGPAGPDNDDRIDRFFDPGYTYVPFQYPQGLQFLKLPEFRQEMQTAPQHFLEDLAVSTRESIRFDNKATESVAAAYFMGDVRLGRMTTLAGVRMEETRFTGKAFKQEITPEERARRAAFTGPLTPEETIRRTIAEWSNRTSASGNYRDYFPSIHFKYEITRGLLARASYSTGIGRPNFGQIVPTMTINNEAQTITSNNPDLTPQYSKNYDLALEYYFEPAGLLSAGVFRKDLTDFIYRANVGTVAPGSMFGDAYTGYTLTTDLNGGSAKIEGLEVSYNQQFTNLTGIWRGFGAFANFTWLRTEGDYGSPGGERVTGWQLPNFTPRAGNAGISYIAHGWTVRVKMNYTGERLQSFNADPSRLTYNTVSKPVDLNIAYAVRRYLNVYADVINVFNAPTNHEYRYIPSRKSRSDKYTMIIKFGVSGAF